MRNKEMFRRVEWHLLIQSRASFGIMALMQSEQRNMDSKSIVTELITKKKIRNDFLNFR